MDQSMMSVQRPLSSNALVDSLVDANGKSVEIEIRRPDFFVNASRICSSYKKDWFQFKRIPRTSEFISDLQEVERCDVVDITQLGGIRCTWIHPDLAIELLAWCNRKFRVAGAALIRRYMTGMVTTAESHAAAEQLCVMVRPESAEPPPQLTQYQQTRVDSILLHDYLSDTLKDELDKLDMPLKNKSVFFAKVNDMCNRALLNLTCTTDALKKQRGIPKAMSIPAMCSEKQLSNLNMLRMNLATFIRDDAHRLTGFTTHGDMDIWVLEKRDALTRVAALLGFHRHGADDLMSVTDARKQTRDLSHIRKQHRLKSSQHIALASGQEVLGMLGNARRITS